jgi:outer membrane murein-binding lipoprotein Lpp
MMRFVLLLAPVSLLLSGCLARTAVDIVTLPVRAVSAGVDALTTSQEEADRERGRRMREEDERRGREAREAERRAREAARRGEDERESDPD